MSKHTYPIRPICRKCFYRRALGKREFANGQNGSHGCFYCAIEGEPRGCTPTDYECEKFKPRFRTKSLTGKHEMIK